MIRFTNRPQPGTDRLVTFHSSVLGKLLHPLRLYVITTLFLLPVLLFLGLGELG